MTKEKFKEKRIQLGLTQAELAEKLGYSRTGTVNDKEAGRRNVTSQDEIILKNLLEKHRL